MERAYNGFGDHGFNLQQTPQAQHHLSHPFGNLPLQRSQFGGFENSIVGLPQQNSYTTFVSSSWANNSFALRAQLEKQRQNIDTFLQLQEKKVQKVRPIMQQEMQRTRALMIETEERVAILLKQKDEEIARLNQRAIQLEEHKRRMEAEIKGWKAIARGKVNEITYLNSTIDQLKDQNEAMFMASNGAPSGFGGVDVKGSCCASTWPTEKMATALEIGENNGRREMMMMCMACNKENSCVLFVPYRHVSLSEERADFIDVCPICSTLGQSKIVVRTD